MTEQFVVGIVRGTHGITGEFKVESTSGEYGHFADMEFMPDALRGKVFYEPAKNKHEDVLRAYLEACWPKYYPK